MKRDIATKWTAALRSGEYQQGKEVLRANDSFCCLGVLCELHRQENGGEWVPTQTGSSRVAGSQDYSAPNGDWDHSLLPEAVADWAGLRSVGPEVGDRELAERNDSGWTFSQLAGLIENNWEAL
jgi:hypothetical protein